MQRYALLQVQMHYYRVPQELILLASTLLQIRSKRAIMTFINHLPKNLSKETPIRF